MFDLVPFRRRENRMERSRRDDPFDYLFSNFFDLVDQSNTGFRTDIKETDEEYILESELPGMKRDDINIEVEDNYLTITASSSKVTEEEDDNYIRRERRAGAYRRSFNIENVKEDDISAEYDNGILKVVLPKKEPTTTSRRTIDIE